MYTIEVLTKERAVYTVIVRRGEEIIATAEAEVRESALMITKFHCLRQFESRGVTNGVINKIFAFAQSLSLSVIGLKESVYLPFARELNKFGFQQTQQLSKEYLWVRTIL